jgi:hypothetical protein
VVPWLIILGFRAVFRPALVASKRRPAWLPISIIHA